MIFFRKSSLCAALLHLEASGLLLLYILQCNISVYPLDSKFCGQKWNLPIFVSPALGCGLVSGCINNQCGWTSLCGHFECKMSCSNNHQETLKNTRFIIYKSWRVHGIPRASQGGHWERQRERKPEPEVVPLFGVEFEASRVLYVHSLWVNLGE